MKTNYHKSLTSFILLAFLLTACVKDIDLPINFKKQVVVVGTLNPDSLISLRLSYSLPPNDANKYTAINIADVSFFENGQLIGQLAVAQNGLYSLNSRPTIGREYAVKIKVAGFDEVYASDTLPPRPVLQLYKHPATGNPNNNPDMELRVLNIASLHRNSIWFDVYVKNETLEVFANVSPNGTVILPGEEYKYMKTHYGFATLYTLSNSQYLDRFNSVFDGLVGKYTFGDPVRIDTDLIRLDPKPIIAFTFVNQILPKYQNTAFMYAFTASETYNRYLKSAISAYQNRLLDSYGNLNNPFAEPTPVYSNVKNGLGIWAGYSAVKIYF
jgi:hypothetical protein